MAKTMRQKVGGFQVLSSWDVGAPVALAPDGSVRRKFVGVHAGRASVDRKFVALAD